VSLFGSLGERVRQGLRRTRELMDEGLGAVLAVARPVDEALLDELEETLIAADLGAATAAAFVKRVRDEIRRGRVVTTQDVRGALHRFLEESLASAAAPLSLEARPSVILMLGVNGAGKTTSTAKLAAALKADGKRVLMAAADTFRAAAIEQLQVWGRRIDVDVIHQAAGADPAAVVFDAMKAATSRSADVLLVDTAGRLHTKSNLMDELAKLKRVLGRQLPGAPHESLMVLDAPTGQNGLQQARMFHEAVGLTGLVLTKLDGTAKGGIAIRIHQELAIPIKLVGVGERIDDLQPFDPKTFVDALLGAPSGERPEGNPPR
jgi:fused signal recognition particle receptor